MDKEKQTTEEAQSGLSTDSRRAIIFLIIVAAAIITYFCVKMNRDTLQEAPLATQPAPSEAVPAVKTYPQIDDAYRVTSNEERGLSEDYPCEVIPLFAGAEVVEQERSETKSADGEPMDSWVVDARSDAEQQEVLEFYKALMLELGMAQTLYISKPGEHGVDYGVQYADENYDVHFEIERRRDDTQTRIKIEVYRLK